MTLNVVLDALSAHGVCLGQPKIVLLTMTKSLKCVQHNVDHWSNDAVDNLQATETAQRTPDQPEFAPRRVCIRHADQKRKCCWELRERSLRRSGEEDVDLMQDWNVWDLVRVAG